MTPKQITKFREKHFPGKTISISRLKMAVEFHTTERTIRAYENEENKNIPGIFVKVVDLWLENIKLKKERDGLYNARISEYH